MFHSSIDKKPLRLEPKIITGYVVVEPFESNPTILLPQIPKKKSGYIVCCHVERPAGNLARLSASLGSLWRLNTGIPGWETPASDTVLVPALHKYSPFCPFEMQQS